MTILRRFLDEVPKEDLRGQRVLARFDFNVPLANTDDIADTTRVDQSLETIRYLLDGGCSKLVMMGHMGRPKPAEEGRRQGQGKDRLSLAPVAAYLAAKLDTSVILTESALDRGIDLLLKLNNRRERVILLENLRFHPEEEAGERAFAKHLASYGDLYVNDAFGVCHRRHASTYHINAFFKDGQRVGGLLLKKEIQALQRLLNSPAAPFVALVGGVKVSDKIKAIERLLVSVDSLLIGGAMAYPFLQAQGCEVGRSLCLPEDTKLAQKILNGPSAHKIQLPLDHVVSRKEEGPPEILERGTPFSEVQGHVGLDIGPKTIAHYREKIHQAKTVFWNGPMGLFENENYARGTLAMAEALAESEAFTVVGGGDSVWALNMTDLALKISHVSTGGGASLEFIQQGTLPGIQALKRNTSL